MTSWIQKYRVPAILSTLLLSQVLGLAAETVTISVQTSSPGAALSETALGLSYETSVMLPDEQGNYYFRPDNKPLVTLFRTLGIKSLRIGGNSVDEKSIPIPGTADVESVFEFARAAGVKVIYSVRLEDGYPQSAAALAKVICDGYADVLDCFAIGNEPGYYKDYDVYCTRWKAVRDAIAAVCPEAEFCGPDQNPKPDLFSNMVRDFGNETDRLVQITVHSYPFGCSYTNPSKKIAPSELIPFGAAASREKMLSPDACAVYEDILKGLTDAVAGTSLTYRLTETNSYWFSGLKGASDSYASALWALEYLHWWTAHGAAGLNFHTGDRTGGLVSMPCRYAAFVTTDAGYEARPLAYGIKMFDLGGHGCTLPAAVTPKSETALVAYAALTADKTVLVTIINKQHTEDTSTDVHIRFDTAAASPQGEVIFLRAVGNDLAARAGDVTVGGAVIRKDGTWNGRWEPVNVSCKDGAVVSLTLPPASAAVVKVKIE